MKDFGVTYFVEIAGCHGHLLTTAICCNCLGLIMNGEHQRGDYLKAALNIDGGTMLIAGM